MKDAPALLKRSQWAAKTARLLTLNSDQVAGICQQVVAEFDVPGRAATKREKARAAGPAQ